MGRTRFGTSHSDARTPIVGRDRELAEVATLLVDPSVCLVTLTGPGGIGKTRLALRVVDEVRDHFAGGVTSVSLGTLRDAALVLPAIIQSFDLRTGGDVTDLRRLELALGVEPRLLLLDNFEHLTGEAPLIAMLVSACPALTVLVTSRAPLRLSLEREFPLAPLELSSRREGLSADEAATAGAVSLFVQRAQAVKPDFALTDENAATVAEIVARLDGLPLAIELAAVRSKVLAPKALLARLSNRLSILTGGARDLPERLRTMRSAIAWSHDLLDTDAAVLFRRLAVFNGSFSLDAAEAIATGVMPRPAELGAAPDIAPLDVDVLDGIALLVDNSLLTHAAEEGGESRYRMLGTVREFGLDQLAGSSEEHAIRERHAVWALGLATDARPYLFGSQDQPAWLQRLDTERDLFRSALSWAFAEDRTWLAARIAGSLWVYWFSTDNLREGATWLERARERIDQLSGETRLMVLCGSGFLALVRLRFEFAVECLDRLLELATAEGNNEYAGWAYFGLGIVAQDDGDPARAQVRFESACERFALVPDRPALLATATQNLGLVISRQGDRERGAALVQAALDTFRRLGFELGMAIASRFLAEVKIAQGEDVAALSLLLQSLRVNRTITQQWHIANALEAVAGIAARHAQATEAVTLFGAIDAFRDHAAAPLEPALQAQHDRVLAALRDALGEAAFTTAWDAGRGMPVETAITIAEQVDFAPSAASKPAAAPVDAHGLTPREYDVLRLLVDGKSTVDIAELLFISPRTVSTHIASILGKLGVSTRSAAVAFAMRSNLV